MFLEIILAIIIGIVAGMITGLTPGIHINLIASLILINFFFINQIIETNIIIIFIISMGITHTFLDFIPSILFGIPDTDNVLSVLPAHKKVLEGNAIDAIYISSLGSLIGLFIIIPFFPIIIISLEFVYTFVKPYIPYILITVIIILLILDKKINTIIKSLIIISLSGSLGILLLNSYITNNPLLLIFTGFFGIASIIDGLLSKTSRFPKQNNKINYKITKNTFKLTSIGAISSTICSISPGMGNSQAATLSSIFIKNVQSEDFILITSAINTINFVISIITLYTIDKARNGAILTISQIKENILLSELILYLSIVIIISIFCFFLNNYLGRIGINIIQKLNFKLINILLLLTLITIIFISTNLIGILIVICTTALGLYCVSSGSKRIHLMSVLLIPVIINLI